MTKQVSTEKENRTLRFPCSCVSAATVADDPWAEISKQHKLQDGTKELILNSIYRSPRTIAQLADELHLSQPTVHRHVTDLNTSQLICEVSVPDEDRLSAVERYYAPNFPVILASERNELLAILEGLARDVSEVFRRHQHDVTAAFTRASPSFNGNYKEAVRHWMYTTVMRMAREHLQEQGLLPPWPEHADGSRWLWWAEEPASTNAAT
jgi:DNA-binding transcriptional ArsR family regulator